MSELISTGCYHCDECSAPTCALSLVNKCNYCGGSGRVDCGYLERTYCWEYGMYEYDCIAPDYDEHEGDCDGCPHCDCPQCKGGGGFVNEH